MFIFLIIISLVTGNVQYRYIQEVGFQQFAYVNQPIEKCELQLSRLVTEKRVCLTRTFVYLPECMMLSKANLSIIISKLRKEGWQVVLEELRVKMSPFYLYGTLIDYKSGRFQTSGGGWLCAMQYDRYAAAYNNDCYMTHNTLHKRYDDGIVTAPRIMIDDLIICPDRLTVFKYDLRV